MLQEQLDAFVIEDVAVLHAVCPQPDGVLDRFGLVAWAITLNSRR